MNGHTFFKLNILKSFPTNCYMRDLAQARDERLNSRGNTLSVCLSVCLVWVLNAKMADLIQDLITESLILVRSSPQQVSPVGSG